MQMLWTAKNNSFIPDAMREQYVINGWDLADCVNVSEAMAAEFMGEPPINKMRIVGNDGLPTWADMPLDIIPLETARY